MWSQTRTTVMACALLAVACAIAACGTDPVSSGTLSDVAILDALPTDTGCVTAIDCPDDGDPCTRAQCSHAGCLSEPVDGVACDDGEPCTADDKCVAGQCKAGHEICECRDDARCKLLLDSSACLGTLWCDVGVVPHVCRRKSNAPVCATGGDTNCAKNQCDPTAGACAMKPVNNGASCSDGDVCTDQDRCEKGSCKAGESICECVVDKDCPTDNDLCTPTYYCDTTKPLHVCRQNQATKVTCPTKDVGPCKANLCDPKDGQCKAQPLVDGVACDDGDSCTQADACSAGDCKPGVDNCVCTKQSDCEQQEDGDLCNGVLYCDVKKGKCLVLETTIVTCPGVSDTLCKNNLCNPKTGTCAMTAVKPGTPCNDGDICTVDEVCVGGGCGNGTNTCPCTATKDCVSKEDDNLCNGTLFCNQQTKACQLDVRIDRMKPLSP